MQILDRCARWGVDNGLVLSWKKSRMRQDKRKVKYTMTIAPQRYRGMSPSVEEGHEACRAPVERFYERLGAKVSALKLAQDIAVAETLLAEGFCPEDLTFAVEWAIAHVPSVKSFGLIPYIMHQAIKARDDVQHAEEAQREAEARIDDQLNREREEQERRHELAEIRARLPEDVVATLRARAQEALATEGVARTYLGYEVLVKLKVDEFLEQEYRPMDMHPDGSSAEIVATSREGLARVDAHGAAPADRPGEPRAEEPLW